MEKILQQPLRNFRGQVSESERSVSTLPALPPEEHVFALPVPCTRFEAQKCDKPMHGQALRNLIYMKSETEMELVCNVCSYNLQKEKGVKEYEIAKITDFFSRIVGEMTQFHKMAKIVNWTRRTGAEHGLKNSEGSREVS